MIHIEEMGVEVTVVEGELPLSAAQTEKLVQLVLSRLGEKQRQAAKHDEATAIRQTARPRLQIGE